MLTAAEGELGVLMRRREGCTVCVCVGGGMCSHQPRCGGQHRYGACTPAGLRSDVGSSDSKAGWNAGAALDLT